MVDVKYATKRATAIISNLFLAILILFLVYKLQWVRILSLGIIMTYGIHFIWVVPKIIASTQKDAHFGFATSNYYDLMNFVFLTSYWLVFFVGVHLVRSGKDTVLGRILASTNFGNIVLYSVLSYPLVLRLFYDQRS